MSGPFPGSLSQNRFGKRPEGRHWEKGRSSKTKRDSGGLLDGKYGHHFDGFAAVDSDFYEGGHKRALLALFRALAQGQSENAIFAATRKTLLKMSPTQLEY